MTTRLTVLRAGPLTTVQDQGRFGMLRHGISASGPMDRAAFGQAGCGGRGGIEITRAGIDLKIIHGACTIGFAGGQFTARLNDQNLDWPGSVNVQVGDRLSITPGPAGNYGYVRFGTDFATVPIMGSIATSSRARLGGLEGRALQAGDLIELTDAGTDPVSHVSAGPAEGPIRIIWGLHADLFPAPVRGAFLASAFIISTSMDRMGVRLADQAGVFANASILSLPSDAIVPGDIQILGDGTPIVLMRDHQPTGGYPRIATIVSADFDRFAQMRPGSSVAFAPVTLDLAHSLLRSSPS